MKNKEKIHACFSVAPQTARVTAIAHDTYIHTYMPFHFINPSKPLGFGYETCPQDVTNTIKHTQTKPLHIQIIKY